MQDYRDFIGGFNSEPAPDRLPVTSKRFLFFWFAMSFVLGMFWSFFFGIAVFLLKLVF